MNPEPGRKLRETCGKCKAPVGPWKPIQVASEDVADVWSVTCDRCGNNMSSAIILPGKFLDNVNGLADVLKDPADDV